MAYVAAQPGGAAQQGAKIEHVPDGSEMAAITVAERIPQFWAEMPRLWFAQLECILTPQKQGDDAKFNIVISKLTRDALQQVSDLVYQPPETNKYKAVKDRLLATYEESAEKQFQRMISGMDLGTQRPSQLLRRMRECGRNVHISDASLKTLWTSKLPATVRTVLTVSQDQDLEELAKTADRVMESFTTHISEISGSGGVAANTSANN